VVLQPVRAGHLIAAAALAALPTRSAVDQNAIGNAPQRNYRNECPVT
jgi:hypothetical protein